MNAPDDLAKYQTKLPVRAIPLRQRFAPRSASHDGTKRCKSQSTKPSKQKKRGGTLLERLVPIKPLEDLADHLVAHACHQIVAHVRIDSVVLLAGRCTEQLV